MEQSSDDEALAAAQLDGRFRTAGDQAGDAGPVQDQRAVVGEFADLGLDLQVDQAIRENGRRKFQSHPEGVKLN